MQNIKNQSFYQGLILLGLILFASYLLEERGLIGTLLEGDRSYLSLFIFAVWAVMSLRWLYLLRWVEAQHAKNDFTDMGDASTRDAVLTRWLNHGWLAADSVLKLGLLGTIIGFIFMLAPIADLKSYDAASLQTALAAMSGGMAIALYTTLTGLIANLLLRLQFQLLGDAMQNLSLEAD